MTVDDAWRDEQVQRYLRQPKGGEAVASMTKGALVQVIADALPYIKRERRHDHETDAEVMGAVLAALFEFSGREVLVCTVAALTEANFHEEAAAVAAVLVKLEGKR